MSRHFHETVITVCPEFCNFETKEPMMKHIAWVWVSTVILHSATLICHGFASNTLVALHDADSFTQIKFIGQKYYNYELVNVASYKEKTGICKNKKITGAASCIARSYIRLVFVSDDGALSSSDKMVTIDSSPLQHFFDADARAWVAAHQLQPGHKLLCKNESTTILASAQRIDEPILLDIIEVKKYHTYFVSQQKIVTHNMFIPIATTLGFVVPFDLVFQSGVLGCIFGPVSFCCSIAIAGIAVAAMYQHNKEKATNFVLERESSGKYDMRSAHKANKCFLATLHEAATLEDVLSGTIPGRKTRGPSVQYEKPGNYDDALKDFEDLKPRDVGSIPGKEGKTGVLSDGRKVTVRVDSSDKRPTLEVQPQPGSIGKYIKIRYGNKN